MAEKKSLREMLLQPMKSMEESYAGVLPPNELPKAKNDLARIERNIRNATPQNSCGTALHGMARRARLLREQILRSEKV